ncbi:hypothetical protein JTE90_000781 [Oedothorax gibbosus]|uniref:Elongator complex protein 6 n=1 Tax=Oedothorax gibbosus TaxID=931172 RepID=A0AAV6UAG4_9ARAC|nr:hypothetical protein JTE90_000781 [Oedothorax gibbosus]
MSSDITSLLNLENDQKNKTFIFATKDSASDLNFFYSEILSFYLKRNYSVIIVNLAQSYSHYTHLLLKSGVNLRSLKDQEKVVIVDLMAEAGSLIKNTASESSNIFQPLISNGESVECLRPLFDSVKNAVDKLKPKGCVILIDDINVSTTLGVSLRAVQMFVKHLLLIKMVGEPFRFLFGSFIDECDTENGKVRTYLNKLADINVHVEGLKTGYSKDTHGKITVGIKNQSDCSCKQQTLFFKVGDKGAKLLTLGL